MYEELLFGIGLTTYGIVMIVLLAISSRAEQEKREPTRRENIAGWIFIGMICFAFIVLFHGL